LGKVKAAMDTADTSPVSERKPWFTFTLTSLFSLGCALLAGRVAWVAKHLYEEGRNEPPSFLTKAILIVGPFLWILVLACSGWGVRLLRRVRRVTADKWMLGWFLGSCVVFGGMCYFLVTPFLVMTPLRK
jgi:hypothetical protein